MGNTVTLDKRDLFDFVRGAIKEALAEPVGLTEPEAWSEASARTEECLTKAYGSPVAAPSPATPEAEGAEIQSAVNLVCNHLNEHSRELGGAGMVAEAQDYAHAADLVRRYFGDKK